MSLLLYDLLQYLGAFIVMIVFMIIAITSARDKIAWFWYLVGAALQLIYLVGNQKAAAANGTSIMPDWVVYFGLLIVTAILIVKRHNKEKNQQKNWKTVKSSSVSIESEADAASKTVYDIENANADKLFIEPKGESLTALKTDDVQIDGAVPHEHYRDGTETRPPRKKSSTRWIKKTFPYLCVFCLALAVWFAGYAIETSRKMEELSAIVIQQQAELDAIAQNNLQISVLQSELSKLQEEMIYVQMLSVHQDATVNNLRSYVDGNDNDSIDYRSWKLKDGVQRIETAERIKKIGDAGNPDTMRVRIQESIRNKLQYFQNGNFVYAAQEAPAHQQG